MELMKGYKQTEVGVIPEDWEVESLGSIGSFSKGQGIRKDESSSGELPCVRYGELYTMHNDYIKKFGSFISNNVAKTSKRLKQGDVLFAGSGETKEDIGKCAAFVDNFEAYAGGDIVVFSPQKGNSLFYGYLFNSPAIVLQKASRGQGDAVVHISSLNLSKVKVPLPPTIREQTAIATALSDTDALIQSLEKLISKKRLVKQGATQELLTGSRRLSGFCEKNEFKKTEFGYIPSDWNLVCMGDVGEIFIGLTYTPSNVKEYGTLVLRSSNIQNGKLAFGDNVYVDMELPKRVIVEKNDILICVRNGSKQLIGKCALIDDMTAGSAFGAFMSIYRSKFSRFIFYQFQSTLIQSQINEVMGATINQITNSNLSGFKLLMPTNLEEQEAIASTLSDMDTEITALEAKLNKYKQIKQGLMQNLLTGRIRLV